MKETGYGKKTALLFVVRNFYPAGMVPSGLRQLPVFQAVAAEPVSLSTSRLKSS